MSEPRKSLDDTGDDESSEDERSYETPEEKRKSETSKLSLSLFVDEKLLLDFVHISITLNIHFIICTQSGD